MKLIKSVGVVVILNRLFYAPFYVGRLVDVYGENGCGNIFLTILVRHPDMLSR